MFSTLTRFQWFELTGLTKRIRVDLPVTGFQGAEQSKQNQNMNHIVRQAALQGVFVKIGDFLQFRGFPVEFLENRRSTENQKPQKIARKMDFSGPHLLQCT